MIFVVEIPAKHYHLTFQFSTKCFWNMNLQNLAKFLHFFFFLFFFLFSRCKSFCKTQKHYLIVLKFGTLKARIKVHPDTKFHCNTINSHKVINYYSQKITPIYSIVQLQLDIYTRFTTSHNAYPTWRCHADHTHFTAVLVLYNRLVQCSGHAKQYIPL